ncbi:hypothetical protein GGE65_002590 [Skermanella aerolata]|uniref:Uncharacterized protein n=1 Tax=Skermanella aerolata TaxID=393310 RepID=A0A512DQC0_9PROT|nr:hypothetical protein [Skermanella aerolata]GEO38664.1 hypothetical protein SAE02_28120 [Skermanella aerolata]
MRVPLAGIWTRAELDALGLPSSMPCRPSEDDFIRYFHRVSGSDPDRCEEARRRHKVRMEAWQARRTVQKEWYARTGLDTLGSRRRRLLEGKHSIERDLMEMMTRPGTAILFA